MPRCRTQTRGCARRHHPLERAPRVLARRDHRTAHENAGRECDAQRTRAGRPHLRAACGARADAARIRADPAAPEVRQRERNPIDICFASLARVYRARWASCSQASAMTARWASRRSRRKVGSRSRRGRRWPTTRRHACERNRQWLVDLLPIHEIATKLSEYIRTARFARTLVTKSDHRSGRRARSRRSTKCCAAAWVMTSKLQGQTFMRRVQRRMHVPQLELVPDYVDLLERDADEAGCCFATC